MRMAPRTSRRASSARAQGVGGPAEIALRARAREQGRVVDQADQRGAELLVRRRPVRAEVGRRGSGGATMLGCSSREYAAARSSHVAEPPW